MVEDRQVEHVHVDSGDNTRCKHCYGIPHYPHSFDKYVVGDYGDSNSYDDEEVDARNNHVFGDVEGGGVMLSGMCQCFCHY